MTGMKLVRAEGAVLQQILDLTHPIWADGLSAHNYARYNDAQMRTPWGRNSLHRYALIDDAGRLLTTAKRYDLTVRLDGREIAAVGFGAVFTPEDERGNGYAARIIERLIDTARHEGAELAILFSEIGTSYYRRLGFTTVPQKELTLSVAEKRGAGAPMVLVRTGEERDIPAVAALASQMTANYRFAAVPSEAFVRYSLSKKRLLAGFSSPGALTVEFFIVEEGAGAVAFAILTAAGEDDVVLEMCGDRDPQGARVGALLQVLRARTPSEDPPVIRGSLPPGWLPPQVSIARALSSPSVMMVKPLREGVLQRPLAAEDVLYWHGDLF
jgi:GNAT superfamily N-acetyltransferase